MDDVLELKFPLEVEIPVFYHNEEPTKDSEEPTLRRPSRPKQ